MDSPLRDQSADTWNTKIPSADERYQGGRGCLRIAGESLAVLVTVIGALWAGAFGFLVGQFAGDANGSEEQVLAISCVTALIGGVIGAIPGAIVLLLLSRWRRTKPRQ